MSPAERLLRPRSFACILLVATAALSTWWGVRFLPNPDEGAVLTNAAKILDGGVFYRDIDAYPYPASNYAVALAMRVFGEQVGTGRALAGALFCLVVLSLYACAVPLLGRARAAQFGASLLAFKLVGFPMFTAYTYADFSFAFGCAALPLLLVGRERGRPGRLCLAGACLALAFGSKQSLGLALFAGALLQLSFPRFFLRRDSDRSGVGWLALGFAAICVPMFGYFAAHGVLGAMLHSGFVRPFTGYLPASSIPAGPMLAWWSFGTLDDGQRTLVYLPSLVVQLLRAGAVPLASLQGLWWFALELVARAVYTSIPVVFGFALWRWLRSFSAEPSASGPVLFGLAQLGFGFVLSASPRFDWPHVVNVYPVVWLLLLALLPAHVALRRAEAVVIALLLASSAAMTAGLHARLSHRLDLERLSVWVEPQAAWVAPVVETIRRRVPEQGSLFVYGHEAHIYFITDRYNRWPFAQLYPGQTGPGGGEAVIEVLERERPRLVYRGLRSWPGSADLADYVPALHAWVEREYEPIKGFFDRHPPEVGEAPEGWIVRLLRPRKRPRDPADP